MNLPSSGVITPDALEFNRYICHGATIALIPTRIIG
jgi:hypothetical protein